MRLCTLLIVVLCLCGCSLPAGGGAGSINFTSFSARKTASVLGQSIWDYCLNSPPVNGGFLVPSNHELFLKTEYRAPSPGTLGYYSCGISLDGWDAMTFNDIRDGFIEKITTEFELNSSYRSYYGYSRRGALYLDANSSKIIFEQSSSKKGPMTSVSFVFYPTYNEVGVAPNAVINERRSDPDYNEILQWSKENENHRWKAIKKKDQETSDHWDEWHEEDRRRADEMHAAIGAALNDSLEDLKKTHQENQSQLSDAYKSISVQEKRRDIERKNVAINRCTELGGKWDDRLRSCFIPSTNNKPKPYNGNNYTKASLGNTYDGTSSQTQGNDQPKKGTTCYSRLPPTNSPQSSTSRNGAKVVDNLVRYCVKNPTNKKGQWTTYPRYYPVIETVNSSGCRTTYYESISALRNNTFKDSNGDDISNCSYSKNDIPRIIERLEGLHGYK